jgi:uncharacterized UPF0160 family protein
VADEPEVPQPETFAEQLADIYEQIATQFNRLTYAASLEPRNSKLIDNAIARTAEAIMWLDQAVTLATAIEDLISPAKTEERPN